MNRFLFVGLVTAVCMLAGCASYSWRSQVPTDKRTVAVPTFRNDSNVTELGAVTTRQILREFQREGTYRLARVGASALEIQGTILNATSSVTGYERTTGMYQREYRLEAKASVSFIDKVNGRVIVDSKIYKGMTTFQSTDDIVTARRDASGRVAEDIARQIVDDALGLSWHLPEEENTEEESTEKSDEGATK